MDSLQMVDKKKVIDFKKVIVFVVGFIMVDLVIVIALAKMFLHEDIGTPVDVSVPEPVEAIYDIYGILIVGNFKLGKDLEFNFGSDGSYSGFFDNENRFVEGYTYQLENNAGQTLVHIYNEDKSRIVTYVMTLSEETGNIILELPGTGKQLELKY